MCLARCAYTGSLEVHLVPRLSRQEVNEQLANFRERGALKAVGNVNPFSIPKRLWGVIVSGGPPNDPSRQEHAIDPAKPWSQLSKADLQALEKRTCCLQLQFVGKDSNKDEFVTAGGISWSEVDTTRMASRLVDGLFFAGEVLDVDGVTGGHNFQSCWTTGFVAGNAAADHVKQIASEE